MIFLCKVFSACMLASHSDWQIIRWFTGNTPVSKTEIPMLKQLKKIIIVRLSSDKIEGTRTWHKATVRNEFKSSTL